MMIEDYRYNAVIPENTGWNAQFQMVLGYNEAVDVLFKEIEANSGSIDFLVYPLFFCARHSVELQLKLLISMVNEFNEYRDAKKNDINLCGHNLEELRNKLENVISISDRRIREEYKKVDVKSLQSFFDKSDPTSQSFRYVNDNEGEKLLKKSFNILKPHIDYQMLFHFLEWMQDVIGELYEEYDTKTYTNKLSRTDLERIAKRLPAKKDWGNQAFYDIREKIKKEIEGFSNTDYSKALDKIKENPYLCSLVGMEIPEEGFSDEFYLLYNKMKDTTVKRESRIDVFRGKSQGFSSVVRVRELSSDIAYSKYDSLLYRYVNSLTLNDCVLFNTYRCIKKYCEEYEAQKEHFSHDLSNNLRDYTYDKMTSGGFLRFEEGLQLCGRTTVLRKLGVPLKDKIDRSEFFCQGC